MRLAALVVGLVLASPLVLACGEDDGDGSDSSNSASNTIKLASFNLGLAVGYIEEAPARIDPIITAISESDADVLCLQELWVAQDDAGEWTDTQIQRVLTGTTASYPHQYWKRTTVSEDAVETGCTIEESDPLESCANEACGDTPPENLGECVLEMCGEEFTATSTGCQGCLVANLGQPLEDIIAACVGATNAGIVYDGHNGLAIISKLPLSATSIVEMDHALTARSVLHATVTAPGDNPVDVYCTHIAADLTSEIAYPEGGTFTSFAEENAAQMTEILALAGEPAAGSTTALLGDFNHGATELADNYQAVLDAGYTDAVADANVGCTFCDENTLNAGGGSGGKLIDHIYIKTSGTVGTSARIFDQAVEITTADGASRMLHLSDHYGVETTIEFE
ncbi:MAG: endonuclease/exonuclease/phosphatase family protein [Nannocystaceae bacterium]|nr:endonuclease/exonuclease/phosphatase family protein [Nannocystaceae bacterium]